jgi:hypothetical protein
MKECLAGRGAPERPPHKPRFLRGLQQEPLGRRQLAACGQAHLPSRRPANGVAAQTSVLQQTRRARTEEARGAERASSAARSSEEEGSEGVRRR